MIKSFGGIILTSLILSSCIYNPDGDSFKEITQREPTQVNLNFFNNQDTILMRGGLNFNINFPTDKDLVYYKFYLDNILIGEDKCCPYSIYLDSRKYAYGFHNLKLELYQKTNSNSLADKLDAEAFVFSYIKPAFIDNTQITSESIKITNIGIEDSVLYIEWTPYTGKGFNNYNIFNLYSSNENILITDQKTNRTKIEKYAGGPIYFKISLSVYEQEVFLSETFDYDINFKFLKTGDEDYQISWNPSPFRSWPGLRLSIGRSGFYNLGWSYEDILINKESISEKLNLQNKFPYTLNLNVTINSDYYGGSVFSKDFSSGFDVSRNIYFLFDQVHFFNDSIYLLMQVANPTYVNYGTISKELVSVNSTKNTEPINTLEGYLALSPNGENLYKYDSWRIERLNPLNFSLVDELNVNDQLTNLGNFISIEASDDKKVLLFTRLNGITKYNVWDWASKSIIYQGNMPYDFSYNKKAELGNGGKTLFDPFSNYKYDIDGEPDPSNDRGSGLYTEFLSHKNDEIFYQYGFLTQRNSFFAYSFNQVSYPKNIKRIISNQTNEFGVLYLESNVLKIDFFKQNSLEFLFTLEINDELSNSYNTLQIIFDDKKLIFIGNKIHFINLNF